MEWYSFMVGALGGYTVGFGGMLIAYLRKRDRRACSACGKVIKKGQVCFSCFDALPKDTLRTLMEADVMYDE
jgi:hypothetical protein